MSSSYKKFMTEMDKKMYNMGKNLIIEVCDRLNKSNKADGLINDLLQKTDKLKKKGGNNKPRRPKTSYQLFLDDVRSKVMKKYPSDNIGAITKKCAKLWGKLKEKDKHKYVQKAEAKKIEYETELESMSTNKGMLTTNKSSSIDNSDSYDSETYDSDDSDNSNSSKNSNSSSEEEASSYSSNDSVTLYSS